jgi:hypothetical protein
MGLESLFSGHRTLRAVIESALEGHLGSVTQLPEPPVRAEHPARAEPPARMGPSVRMGPPARAEPPARMGPPVRAEPTARAEAPGTAARIDFGCYAILGGDPSSPGARDL